MSTSDKLSRRSTTDPVAVVSPLVVVEAKVERGGVLAVGDVEDLLGDALRSLLTRGRPRLISIDQRLAQLAAGIRDLQHVQGVLKNPSSSAMPSPAAGGRGVRTSLWGVADRRVQAAASFSLR